MREYGATETCGPTMQRRDLQAIREYWTHLVGVVVAPKSLVPCAVYLHEENDTIDEGYGLMSPSRDLLYAVGYLELPHGWNQPPCLRQHAHPGVCRPEDRGAGFGTALYLGGLMVATAAEEDFSGQFPLSRPLDSLGDRETCTFSMADEFHSDGRTPHASGVWQRFRDRGWARSSEDGQFDLLDWPTVLQTGLVLYLSRDFPPRGSNYHPREIVPPQAIGLLDWRETPARAGVRYLQQNADLLGTREEKDAYMAACVETLRNAGTSEAKDIAREVLSSNPTAPRDSYNHFAERDREWLDLYGAGEWA